jgi:hypothetical protein
MTNDGTGARDADTSRAPGMFFIYIFSVRSLQLFAHVCSYYKSTQVWRIFLPESCNTDISTTINSIDKWFVVFWLPHLRAAPHTHLILGFAVVYITVRLLSILQLFYY